ncbi:carbamoyl-phosphate synthase [Synechococcus sp. CCY9202]|uniref:carbamoyl-phosphate synthase n=1 Tax=Synechococcus sp. CCY9202 TaxID=174698 RepID=UPI002B1E9088|nr:carbamoyl-phosphate synthase [Synechococcus sp. CCY9202]MEA5424356.1 carbamoyl-phosphate synthase [Synechococcus sp. CCY9202]
MQSCIRLSLSLTGTAALALASLPFGISPAAAQDPEAASTEAADLGVMGVNLRDAVKFNYGFQGALQGAGTPNQAGLGAFIPLHVGSSSVAFVDVLVNANFNDYGNYSSIINTDVSGTTFSTSTRLGYRWLNGNRSWMFGVNAGYDSRPMATGPADTGVTVTNSQTGFFQQVSAGVEAVSNSWNFNAYALVPVGDTEQQLNSVYDGGALDTYGLDVGYSITPELRASVGYYYQSGDLGAADGSGVRGRLAYNLTNGLTVGANLSYDQAFETRVSADIKYRFGTNGYGAPSIRKQQPVVIPVIQALSTTPANRDVRVHDAGWAVGSEPANGQSAASQQVPVCCTTPAEENPPPFYKF